MAFNTGIQTFQGNHKLRSRALQLVCSLAPWGIRTAFRSPSAALAGLAQCSHCRSWCGNMFVSGTCFFVAKSIPTVSFGSYWEFLSPFQAFAWVGCGRPIPAFGPRGRGRPDVLTAGRDQGRQAATGRRRYGDAWRQRTRISNSPPFLSHTFISAH